MAAATYFMELHDFVLRTGDLTEWEAVTAVSCGFCTGVRDDVMAVYGAGERYVEGAVDLGPPEIVGFDADVSVFAVQLDFSAATAHVVDANGETVRVLDGGHGYLVLDVAFGPEGWELLGAGARDEPVTR